MSNYKEIFENVLNEYKIPDTGSNPDDVKFDDEVDASVFEVNPMDSNVGFKSNNMKRDINDLKEILESINGMTDKMKSISEKLAELTRSFGDIGKSSKTVANINQKLHDLNGELEGYIISLPAQKGEEEKNMEPNIEGGADY